MLVQSLLVAQARCLIRQQAIATAAAMHADQASQKKELQLHASTPVLPKVLLWMWG